ncbi:MAG: hypothetical protein CMJ78_17510 [Planctomycetaceae bacterium]|nr:hypothetical protein [Planctomycetaceae bacterium]
MADALEFCFASATRTVLVLTFPPQKGGKPYNCFTGHLLLMAITVEFSMGCFQSVYQVVRHAEVDSSYQQLAGHRWPDAALS